jgi:hypothetical protein
MPLSPCPAHKKAPAQTQKKARQREQEGVKEDAGDSEVRSGYGDRDCEVGVSWCRSFVFDAEKLDA